jgi:Cu(I)/Ag(I) efflux system membrane fusion protein/cobalt-zinc-cadmium efflux system membrane fusion protein
MNRPVFSYSTICRQAARTWVWIVVVIAAVAVGFGFGLMSGSIESIRSVAGDSRAGGAEASSTDPEQWYTCGMHPNVLQKWPGDCPICHMKLTPLKKDEGDAGKTDGPSERKILYWRAPMDPNYISEKPGKSPMGMDLVPVYADEGESTSAHTIRIDPVTVQNMGIRTAALGRGPLFRTIRTVGRVDYDEQTVTFVNTRFEGWIENLSVGETGVHVRKGDPLFEVYSPVLYSAQEEYLIAMNGVELLADALPESQRDARGNLQAAHTQLRDRFGLNESQVDALRRDRRVARTVTMPSPATGIVTEKMALEGMYVMPGMRLYTIADLSRVWVYVDVYEYQLPWVRIGQRATMTLPYTPGEAFVGKVVYIYPYLDPQTRVVKVRLEFDNPDLQLKPGMYANIRLESELQGDALLIPREAYIDSGTRKVAFVDAGQGRFAPRDIQVGVEAEDGMVEVLYGLDAGEVVVTSGQFMLDAESKLKEAVAKMMKAERATTTQREPAKDVPAGEDGPIATASGSGIPTGAAYACAMDKHPDEADPDKQGPYFSAEPGTCPRCGMILDPLDSLAWVRVLRAAQSGEVGYTCPDHPHVFAKGEGECPRCGKKLKAFKAMYTCPNPGHAGVVRTASGPCPECGRPLAAFRGVWLAEDMADANVPEITELAEGAMYRCRLHPLVHSDRPGDCTICAVPLDGTDRVALGGKATTIPPDATHTCPMEACNHFSSQPGQCPVCGMALKPIGQVEWAKQRLADETKTGEAPFVCPMHPHVVAAAPGGCSVCGMQLVHRSRFAPPHDAPSRIAAQVNYIVEHYLEIQQLLASDRVTDLPRQALGLAQASQELLRERDGPGVDLPAEVAQAARRLHDAALDTTGERIERDRVTFVELSAAVRTLITHARPDRQRWPELYIYHCPMSKGDWIQAGREKANPYYGFKMLNCGELQETK